MMEKYYLIIVSVLFSAILGIIGYWAKYVHREIKTLLKELINYTQHLKSLIVEIQVQIEKGIESDIKDLKTDVKNLYGKTAEINSKIIELNAKSDKKC
ncbi:MAG: hypothetical protein HRT72_10685 [Flavobacteriales bacterium]|nr:hypothetical protein [Flavobacteriales bacterium]